MQEMFFVYFRDMTLCALLQTDSCQTTEFTGYQAFVIFKTQVHQVT